MRGRVQLLWGCLLFAGSTVMSQDVQDSLQLDAVTISASRGVLFDAGVKMQAIDSATMERYQGRDLGELLRDASPVFVKSYGMGSLATTSFRGGGASHTAVLWNGFNLGSAMNGQLDLSLVPAGIAQEVSLQYGGAATLWGSGAVGGVVLLDSRLRFGKGLTLDAATSLGSFGDNRQQLAAGFSNDRWSATLRAYRIGARNDFPYNRQRNGEVEQHRQVNAAMETGGMLAEVGHRINEHQRMDLHVWWNEAERQVPPTLMQDEGADHQHDRALRTTAQWQRVGDKVTSQVRAAWFNEQLWWYGDGADSAAYSRLNTLVAEGEMRFRKGERHLFGLGLHGTLADAATDGYPMGRRQERAALFASWRFRTKDRRFTGTASIRQEVTDGSRVPFTWSFGGEYGLAQGVSIKANASRLYRLPTLNDLYWTPGGDPGLRPESGYSGELGLAVRREPGKGWQVGGEFTGYHRIMNNWIIWLPAGNYWSPQNLMQVWSRGMEFLGEVGKRIDWTTITAGVVTNYAVSTNERAKTAGDASVGKQLIYVPMYSGGGRLGVTWRAFSVGADAHYTGYRYTSSDNRSFLAPYTLLNAHASWRFRAGRQCRMSITAEGFNLLDEQYQVMLNRPMPLRHFQVGVRMTFDQPLREKKE
ncbi:MAG TPA: TonB-dependent receptor [Flavobacteriales bacterium]|nr:TonB-dependent receptor [Flavobacteriales bacterium]